MEKKPVGAIQVLIKSVGAPTQRQFVYDESHLRLIDTKEKLLSKNAKKKVKVRPLNMEKVDF